MKVAVLMGGISREREISIRSGERVYKALQSKGYEVEKFVVNEDFLKYAWNLREFDAVFVALHGNYGEDGTIQGILEYLRVPYTGSGVLASSTCFDKLRSYEILDDVVTLPKYKLIRNPTNESPFGFPCVLKPRREGSSIGVHICHSPDELLRFSAEELKVYGDMILMEYVRGRELTVSVIEIDGKPVVLPILELIPKKEFYDFEAKYTPGMTEFVLPAPLSEEEKAEVVEATLRVYEKLGCSSFARVDGILKDGKFYFLEVNSIPGMTQTSDLPASAKAMGLDFEDLVEIILKTARLKGG